MRNFIPALDQQFDDIAEAEFVAKPLQRRQEHDVSRAMQIVERHPGALVEATSAGAAAEPRIAERGRVLAFRRRSRRAVRAVHELLLGVSCKRQCYASGP